MEIKKRRKNEDKIKKMGKPCPYCKQYEVIRSGKYYVKAKPHYRQMYRCVKCNRWFNYYKLFNRYYISGWDNKLFIEVKKLINKKGYFPDKRDSRKDKRFLSSNGIIKVLNRKRRYASKRIDRSIVQKMIRRYRIEV